MKKYLLFSLLSSFILAGCSSVKAPNLEQFTHSSGGEVAGDATSLYWMTERLKRITMVSDSVNMGDFGSYQSDYRWSDGELRELIRKGEQLNAKHGLVPFQIHIRFNKDGDAIYQQYRMDGKVLPLQRDQLEHYKKKANDVVELVQKQSRDDQSLIQGYWDGVMFKTCGGRELATLEFKQNLPKFVMDRLASVDSYIAFIGKESRNTATVDELLILNDNDFDCVPRPKLISK
ncbi:DUF1481 domain-containing protein [Vibrio sagamiensis]|uniref:Peptidyl-prolyl cis-trans isomerase n=1 Tax=Vibrio sagamiensis NBRC 104589 TaxID=1219064 RepID=A0A511QIZ8_9VIBR|nr:DUF1481 domain-containing protein [Vibrio sagamiensis]PNQ69886.1 DUF1481 domain-containing protein [Vibrio agarivorans]GEM77249.1 peptidyl-prolyl cis-trans isomerase [Vibrio sagamiensis NBRC 104589]